MRKACAADVDSGICCWLLDCFFGRSEFSVCVSQGIISPPKMVATLSISGAHITPQCDETVRLMRSLGIHGDVTPNRTILDGTEERGCRIVIASRPHRENAEKLWTALRATLNLRCAHVSLQGEVQSGCAMDVFRESLCSGAPPGTTATRPS